MSTIEISAVLPSSNPSLNMKKTKSKSVKSIDVEVGVDVKPAEKPNKKRSKKETKNVELEPELETNKIIEKILGCEYKVVATMGHLMELKSLKNIDIENGFHTIYEPIESKKQTINHLRKEINNAQEVFLACDGSSS